MPGPWPMQTAFKSSHKFQEEWDREMSLARGPLPLLGQKSRERGKQFYREKGFRKRKLEAPRGMVSRERRPMGTLRVEGAPHLSPVPPQHVWLCVCVWGGGFCKSEGHCLHSAHFTPLPELHVSLASYISGPWAWFKLGKAHFGDTVRLCCICMLVGTVLCCCEPPRAP